DLGRFDDVNIDLREVTAEPFEIQTFALDTVGDDRYRIQLEATASIQDLARFGGSQFGPLGALVGELAGNSAPFSDAPVPVKLDGEVESKDGEAEMVAGGGEVAGIPAG